MDWGDWVLRARSPVDISVVSEHLPDALQEWLRRATRDAIAMFDSVDDDDAASFHGAARRLRQELDALDRTT